MKTERAEGKMAFVGVGGEIEGVVNPTLRVAEAAEHGRTLIVEGDMMNDSEHPKGALLFMLVYLALMAAMWVQTYLKLWRH
ncbi:MAG: hypothetical protein HY216_03280 [Candidatus Rokubacteria bacterium]|nr:hypothetical protein [Candidatus Rokubacteria bacterium]